MEINKVLSILNDKDALPNGYRNMRHHWSNVHISTSLHTLGACPKFQSLGGLGGVVTPPAFYGEKYQERFDKILFSRHPREDNATRQWRFSQYKPLTREPFMQLSEMVLGSIFQDSNYGIQINNENDRNYILYEKNFNGFDLIGWFISVGYNNMINDPNGYFVRMPKYAFYEKRKLEIELLFVKSENIIYASDDVFIFQKGNNVFSIDHQVIWRYSYDSSEEVWYVDKQDQKGYYAHLLGRLPCDIAGGVLNTFGFYESFYCKAIPIADEFISSYSAEQLVDKEASHPYIQMTMEQCGQCKGTGAIQVDCLDCIGGKELQSCGKCQGKGEISINPADRLNVPAEMMDRDLVRIINPNISINSYHHGKNKDIRDAIYDALHLLKISEAQSGFAKTIDQEKLHNMISKIGNHIFDNHIYTTIKDIIAYRNVVSINGKVSPYEYGFTIVKPKQYHIRTSQSLFAEYQAGLNAKLPIVARRQMFLDFMDKQYSGDAAISKKIQIIDYYDPLLCVTEEEKLNKLATGEIDRNQLINSSMLPFIIDTLILEKGYAWFEQTNIRDFRPFIGEKLEQYLPKATTFNPAPEIETGLENETVIEENTDEEQMA